MLSKLKALKACLNYYKVPASIILTNKMCDYIMNVEGGTCIPKLLAHKCALLHMQPHQCKFPRSAPEKLHLQSLSNLPPTQTITQCIHIKHE